MKKVKLLLRLAASDIYLCIPGFHYSTDTHTLYSRGKSIDLVTAIIPPSSSSSIDCNGAITSTMLSNTSNFLSDAFSRISSFMEWGKIGKGERSEREGGGGNICIVAGKK